jgi:DNA-binding LytR/AlgR family response regulator
MSKKLKISKLLNRIMLINCKTILFSSIDDIVFIKSDDVYVQVFNPQGSELIKGTLKKIIKLLPKYFIHSHKSYIINAKHIVRIDISKPCKYTAVMDIEEVTAKDNKIKEPVQIPITKKAYKKLEDMFS